MKKFKAGYMFEVSTWENDADRRMTKTVSGFTKDQAVAVNAYLEIFKKSDWQGGFGNIYEPSFDQIDKFNLKLKEIYLAHKDAFDSMDITPDEDLLKEGEDDVYTEMFWELEDELGISSTEFYTRKVDSVKIYLLDHDVEFNEVNLC